MTVSAAFLVLDPPIDRLAALLERIRPVVSDVVIVVDMRTRLETVDALSAWRDVTLVPFRWVDDFAAARNAGLAYCTGDWILHLDPDEWPSDRMLAFIEMVAASEWVPVVNWQGQSHPDPRGYLFWTTDGDGNGDPLIEHDWHCRLFRRELGHWYKPVHEQVMLEGFPEDRTRETPLLVKAPRSAFLYHRPDADRTAKDELYRRLERVPA
ncbi:MAG TPA: glycosyltransferase [Candidatus Limnocylindrales bacterium]